MTGSRTPATSSNSASSAGSRPSTTEPGGRLPSKERPSGSNRSAREQRDDFLRLARAM